MSWFDDHASELEAAGVSRAAAEDFVSRNPGDEHRAIEALTNYTGDRQYDSQGPEINNGNGALRREPNIADTGRRDASGNRIYGNSGGGASYGAFMGGEDFGAAPEPFGETYAPLARPSYLQGEYVPGQWGETFTAPAKPGVLQEPFALPIKPGVLQTPYALPTQAELEASPGYLSGQTAAQRGMERSAASKGSVLSGGFAGRALPRAMNEYAGTAYGNLVSQTLGARQQQAGEYTGDVTAALGARQQQQGEYQGDVSNAFQQYQQRYGQFADAEGLKLGARNVNESAYQGDEATNLAGYKTRYGAYLDQAGLKRQAESDLWSRNLSLSDLSLRAAALAKP